MLTFVVAGGGFSGTEVAAALNDFLRTAARLPLDPAGGDQVVLVHSGRNVLERELTRRRPVRDRHARRARHRVAARQRLVAASPHAAVLADGKRIATRTLISTSPRRPPDRRATQIGQHGRTAGVRRDARGPGRRARVGARRLRPRADARRAAVPPTAQHAIRQAKVLAHNIVAEQSGARRRSFAFTGLGKLGALGHRRALAELPGGMCLSGAPRG